MTRTISAGQARRQLGDILDRVALRHDEFIIARRGQPLAAVVPMARLEQLRRVAAGHLLALLERQAAHTSEAEADAAANEATHASRPAPRTR